MGKGLRRVITFLTGTAVAWAFAVKPRLFGKPDLGEIRRYDYAHRGLHNSKDHIPENSLLAFQKAMDMGYGISMDVRITKEGVPVVFRDSRLHRMCQEAGTVETSTLEMLQQMRLEGTEEEIPTLEAALALVDGQVPVLLNLHVDSGNFEELCSAVCDVLDGYDGVFAVEAFDVRVLKWFKEQRNNFIRGQMIDHGHRSGQTMVNRIWDFFCNSLLMNFLTAPDFISCNLKDRKNPSLILCHLLYRVERIEWTVHNLEEYELVKTDGSIAVFEDLEL